MERRLEKRAAPHQTSRRGLPLPCNHQGTAHLSIRIWNHEVNQICARTFAIQQPVLLSAMKLTYFLGARMGAASLLDALMVQYAPMHLRQAHSNTSFTTHITQRYLRWQSHQMGKQLSVGTLKASCGSGALVPAHRQ